MATELPPLGSSLPSRKGDRTICIGGRWMVRQSRSLSYSSYVDNVSSAPLGRQETEEKRRQAARKCFQQWMAQKRRQEHDQKAHPDTKETSTRHTPPSSRMAAASRLSGQQTSLRKRSHSMPLSFNDWLHKKEGLEAQHCCGQRGAAEQVQRAEVRL